MLLNRPPGPIPERFVLREAYRPSLLRRLWWLIRSIWT